MASRSGITWDDRALMARLQTMPTQVDRALTGIMAFHATRALAYAKTNAPWRDRTSNARNGLFSVAERDRPAYRIVIGHSVPYGVWLETRWSGRYAIIRPTIDHEGPQVMATVSTLFARILRGR